LLNGTVNKQILANRKDFNDKTLKYIKEDLDLKIQILNELKNNRATELESENTCALRFLRRTIFKFSYANECILMLSKNSLSIYLIHQPVLVK